VPARKQALADAFTGDPEAATDVGGEFPAKHEDSQAYLLLFFKENLMPSSKVRMLEAVCFLQVGRVGALTIP
jgi:hypothetical protein